MATTVTAPLVSTPAPSGPVSAPAAPAGATVNSLLDSAFAPPAPTAEPAAPASPAPDAAPAAPLASPEPAPVTEPGSPEPAVAAPEPDTPAAPELDFTDNVEPDSKSEDGKRHFYTESKSLRLQQAGKFVKAVQEIIPNASVDEIKTAVEISHAAQAMMLKFHEGAQNVQAVDEVLEAFKANDNPAAYGMMAIRMLSQLPQVEPGAAQFVKNQFNQGLLNDLTARARSATDQGMRDNTVALIQNLQIALSGNPQGYQKAQDILAGGNPDPIATRQADLDRREQQIRDFQASQQQQAKQNVVSSITSVQNQTMQSVIDEALKPVKANYENTPEWAAIRKDFESAIYAAEQSHPEWRVKLDNLRTEAMLNGGSEQSLQNFTNYWRSILQAIVRPNSKTILDRWGNRTVATNQAANRAAANRPPNEPAPNGVASMPQNGFKIDDALKAKGPEAVYKAIGW